jgi:hypothetical protein
MGPSSPRESEATKDGRQYKIDERTREPKWQAGEVLQP